MRKFLQAILFAAASTANLSASASQQSTTRIVGKFPSTIQEAPTPIPWNHCAMILPIRIAGGEEE